MFHSLWYLYIRGDLFKIVYCVILCLCFSVLLALRLPLFGKRYNLSAFRTFVRFAIVWFCLFSLPPPVWEGLRLVIVALPGLFSYLFLQLKTRFLHAKNFVMIFLYFNCPFSITTHCVQFLKQRYNAPAVAHTFRGCSFIRYRTLIAHCKRLKSRQTDNIFNSI